MESAPHRESGPAGGRVLTGREPETVLEPDPIPSAPAPAPAAGIEAPAVPRLLRRGPLSPLRHRDFALFWSGAFASNAGTWLQNVALAWLVLEITDSPFWVSMVTFTQFFPMMLLGLVGGLVADRFERRRILLWSQGGMMAVAVALAAITFGGYASVATVLPVVALGGIVLAFNAPAFQAIIADLVPEDALLDAVSLNTAQFSAARVIGPLLGGITLATVGAGWAFAANAASFSFVIAALLLIRPRRHAPPASRGARALFGGFRAMRDFPVIKTIVALVSVLSLFAAPVLSLLPVIAKNVLGLGATGYGGLFAAFSAGAVAGALLTGRVVRRLGVRQAVGAGVGVLGASTVILALSGNVALSAVSLVAIGWAYTSTVSTTNTGLQIAIPATKRGRVMSLYMMAWAGLYPVGSLLGGIAATHVGVRSTLVVAALPLLAAAAWARLRGGGLRNLRV
ncbi:MAG TPA: MFS transporter [Actinomycetota bacterium]|nr:MFS transporter [Actinomycetota bacterium]